MSKERYATQIQSKISAFCLKEGITYNKLINMSKSFFPDIFIVINSITYYFEVKAGNDKLSEGQIKIIDDLNSVNKIAFIIDSFKEFLEIFNTLPIQIKTIRNNKKSLLDEIDLFN